MFLVFPFSPQLRRVRPSPPDGCQEGRLLSGSSSSGFLSFRPFIGPFQCLFLEGFFRSLDARQNFNDYDLFFGRCLCGVCPRPIKAIEYDELVQCDLCLQEAGFSEFTCKINTRLPFTIYNFRV
jgi:hypothetical protein